MIGYVSFPEVNQDVHSLGWFNWWFMLMLFDGFCWVVDGCGWIVDRFRWSLMICWSIWMDVENCSWICFIYDGFWQSLRYPILQWGFIWGYLFAYQSIGLIFWMPRTCLHLLFSEISELSTPSFAFPLTWSMGRIKECCLVDAPSDGLTCLNVIKHGRTWLSLVKQG